MVRRGYENGHQKDIPLEQIGLRVQNVLAILGSIVNTIDRGPMGPLYEHGNLYVDI